MPNALASYQAGRLSEAIEALGVGLREDPANVRQRTFLFELLCFAGEFDRAEKQLAVIADVSHEAEMGAMLYRSALHAERTRQEMFRAGALPQGPLPRTTLHGTLNGRPFESIADVDPRIGARLEIFAAGQFTWLPFEHLSALTIEEPRRLRDLLWLPARLQAGPRVQDFDFGEVLIPVLYPLSWQDPDDLVRLGRITDWQERPDGPALPIGQRLLQVDDDFIPILELRTLEIACED